MESLVEIGDGKKQITIRKKGIPPNLGEKIQLVLPDGSQAIGKVTENTRVKDEEGLWTQSVLEIQAD